MTTTLTISTTIVGGVNLNKANYSAVSVTSTGEILGATPTSPGLGGGEGLAVTFAAPAYNFGKLLGGAGAKGSTASNSGTVATITAGYGGFGGIAALFAYNAVLNNNSIITGGAGADGGSVVNTGKAFAEGGAGGYGGQGVLLASGAYLSNSAAGVITGGAGGNGGGGYSLSGGGVGGAGGLGGAGIYMNGSASLSNLGVIQGGAAGTGGNVMGGGIGAAGVGGDGIDVISTKGVTIVNGSASNSKAIIEGAVGVYSGPFAGGTTVTNFGTIDGIGGLAVQFTSAKDRLVYELGSTFIGSVAGGGGTLEIAAGVDELYNLGGFATVNGLMQFTGFGTYKVDKYHEANIYGASTLTAGKSFIVDGSLAVFNGHTFVNDGSITAYYNRGAVYAGHSAIFTNGASGVVTGAFGVYCDYGAQIVNLGSIAGSGATGRGVWIENAGGSLINGSAADTTAKISGYHAVLTDNVSSSIHNYGTIYGTGGTYATGASLQDGGTLVNGSNSSSAAYIGGDYAGVDGGESITLNNYGLIAQSNTLLKGAGVYAFGGNITNAASGYIFGYEGVSLTFLGYVDNLGTIVGVGTAGAGVAFLVESQLVNGSASNHTALIKGDYGVITPSTSTVTVTNSAIIQGTGGVSVKLSDSTDLLIADAGAKFFGAVQGGGSSLELGGASAGTLTGLGGMGTLTGGVAMTFSGFATYYVDVGTNWIVTGANTLASGSHLTARGGFDIKGTLDNLGSITGNQVTLNGSGARLINETAGYVGTAQGIYVYNGASATNLGTIFNAVPAQQAVRMGVGGAHVVNGSAADTTALLQSYFGVYGGANADTVTNFGAIEGTGGVSVKFINPTDRLIAEAGSAFIGKAEGGGGTLEQANNGGTISIGATGTISGPEAITFSGFGTYQLDAGTWLVAAGSALGVGQTLAIENGVTAQVQGAVANAGTVALISGATNTDLRILAPGVTLSGGGTVSMGGTKAIIIGTTAATTLTNVDNTIVGAGVIGANSMSLINETAGVIDAVGAFGLAIATKGETLVNQGLMEATGGGILAITNTTVMNTGTLLATNLSPVKLQNVVVRGGSIAATGSGVVKFNVAGGELDGTAGAVSLSGVMALVTGSNETFVGSIANAGKINLTAGGATADFIIGAAGATLSGGGQVNLSNALGNRIYGLASGDTLTNVDNRIDGAGLLGNGVMTLINNAKGQIVGNQNLAFTIDTGVNMIVNAGLIENTGKGGTLVKSAVNNTGTLFAATAGTLNLAGAVTGAGVGQINGGTLYVQQAFAENVTFSGTTGVLELGDSQAFTGKVTGLSKTGTDWLDLVDIGFFAAKTKATYSGTTASGTLTVTDGTHTAHITLQGNYTSATWTVSADGHGGTKVVDPSVGGLSQAMASLSPLSAPRAEPSAFYAPPRLSYISARA